MENPNKVICLGAIFFRMGHITVEVADDVIDCCQTHEIALNVPKWGYVFPSYVLKDRLMGP